MKRNAVVVIVISVILIGSGFYWVAVRPTTTRKKCDTDAKYAAAPTSVWKITGENEGGFKTGEFVDVPKNPANGYSKSKYEAYYKSCLRSHGL